MKLLLLGVSHHSAPLEVREQLAVPETELGEAVQRLLEAPGVREGLILSTCNRVEILVNCDATDTAEVDAPIFLQSIYGRDSAALRPYLYLQQERHAVRHVFRVACSLDSLLVGEPQILGQLKQAYSAARAAGGIGSGLEALLTRAFSVAKRVRTDTELGRNPVSISHAAVDLARQIFGTLAGKTVLLLGAGKMGELAARYLVAQGAGRVLVANRTLARAQALATKLGGEAFGLDQLPEIGHRADVIIGCTGAATPVLRREQVAQFLTRRKYRPVLLLDIAVPRDIEPETRTLDNAFLYNVDDLQAVVDANLADRHREAGRAEAIVEAEVDAFLQRIQSLDVVPTIRKLQERAEELRLQELARLRSRLGTLTPEQDQAVDALTRGLMQKWLHRPLVALKDLAGDPSGLPLLDVAERLFGLTASPQPEPSVTTPVTTKEPK
ncbi:MAG: glutamyl-tRNA reductase [Terriglobales bacterium]